MASRTAAANAWWQSLIAGKQEEDRLPLKMLLAYSYPTAGVSFISFFLGLYIFKFATDVLLIAPAVFGLIYAAARVWDAISDPLAGYLSDITQSKYGRRRPWLFASVLPMAVVPVMVWSPPEFLNSTWLIVWMTVGILAYETMVTIVFVPHFALGAEISMDRQERTRVFAFRQVAWSLGFFACIGAVHLLSTAADKRAMAFVLALSGGVIASILVLVGTLQLREKTEHQGRGSTNPVKAIADLVRNPHARLLLMVFLIETLGTATLGIIAPFYMHYVIGMPEAYSLTLFFHFVPSLLIVPVGVYLARHHGKKNMWAMAMCFSAVSFSGFFFAGPGDIIWVLVCNVGTGIGTGIGAVVGPSLQADIIDYDEHVTGERKEGSYFAVWNFVRKAAGGITGAATGFLLQVVGFVPNVEQGESIQLAISILYAGLPGGAMLIGAAIFFFRFSFTEAEHQVIRAELDARLHAKPETSST